MIKDCLEINNVDYPSALIECQRAYRKAAVYETFIELNLNEILNKQAFNPKQLAIELNLNEDALSRFLHASANLGLVEKINDNFVSVKNIPSYTRDSSIVLFWLFNNKIPDILKSESKSLTELMTQLPYNCKEMLESAVKYNLIIQDAKENYSIPISTQKYLFSDSTDYIGFLIRHFEKIMFPMFSIKGLMGALKTGKSQWENFFNKSVSHPFDLYKDDSLLLEIFTNGMHQLNLDDNKIIANNLNFENVKTVLDIGGGSGAFALQMLHSFNSIEKIDIYELPEAIPLMKKIFRKYAPCESKVQFIPGSFLEQTVDGKLSTIKSIEQYDLIILGWILHDWSDKTNIQILNRLIHHLKPTGTLLVLEAILPENKISDVCQLDLTMLLQTEGKERTFCEYQKLLSSSGFKNILINKTNTRRQAITANLF